MVYFISDGTYTKIGKSKNPYSRIKDLQTSNANKLYFSHLFDVKDKYEQVLHKLFKQFKTNSNNEWFHLKDINIELILNSSLKNIPQFVDIKLAEFKASQLNDKRNKDFRQNQIIPNIQDCNKSKIKLILSDVEDCLKNKKDRRISYHKYIVDYGFTKEQVSFFIKSARLNKLVMNHNNKIK
jgi:hypothetical protein